MIVVFFPPFTLFFLLSFQFTFLAFSLSSGFYCESMFLLATPIAFTFFSLAGFICPHRPYRTPPWPKIGCMHILLSPCYKPGGQVARLTHFSLPVGNFGPYVCAPLGLFFFFLGFTFFPCVCSFSILQEAPCSRSSLDRSL